MAEKRSSYVPPPPIRAATPDGRSSPANSSRRPSPPHQNSIRSSSMGPARLQKPLPNPSQQQQNAYAHARASSGQFLAPADLTYQPSLQEIKQQYASRDQFGLPSPPLPAPPMGGVHSRGSSRDLSMPTTPTSATRSRPTTPNLQLPPGAPLTPVSPTSHTDSKKKGWFGRSKKDKHEEPTPLAWIAGHPHKPAYDVQSLLYGLPASELWDDVEGNCFVYLFPKSSGKGPSFKVDSVVFTSSPILTKLAFGDFYSHPAVVNGDRKNVPLEIRTQNLAHDGQFSPPQSPSSKRTPTDGSLSSRSSRQPKSTMSDSSAEAHLYLTLKLTPDALTGGDNDLKTAPHPEDLQTIVDFRNFFAFLCGQSLVATEKRASLFSIFMTIASLLKVYEFTNLDASTFGEIPSTSFDKYVDELGLADVRMSREKTIEGVVLGERMKSILLYNEAFTHAVGKLNDLNGLQSHKWDWISSATKTRLARASMDLDKREQSVNLILREFDFPSIFNGIMNSKTAVERKEGVRFDGWKEAFQNTRRWMISLLKQRYGDWPPKAKSKKNNLETSGLQRVVLRDLYHDMSSMYDLLADRTQLTTRTVDGIDRAGPREAPQVRALRSILSEYDRSSPPVKPPIPFDLPKMPTLSTTRQDFGRGDNSKDAKAATKKLKDEETAQILRASWNDDAFVTPFINAFRDMERRAAHGSSLQEIVDLRIGQWIFMYAVLQALPMLACDAPGLKHTQGVEYFLCEPPRSGVPWADPEKAVANRRTWFSVTGVAGGSVVSLPSDIVEHGVEGIYRRSHCWQMAERWAASNPLLNEALLEHTASNAKRPTQGALAPPSAPGTLATPSIRSGSPAPNKRHSSLGIGLEALPLPAGVTPDGRKPIEAPRSAHNVDSSKTFDAILANVNAQKPAKKK